TYCMFSLHSVVLTRSCRFIYFFYSSACSGSYTLSLHDALPILVIIAFLVLWQYNFNIGTMFTEVKSATVHGADYLKPGLKYKEGLGTISLMLALVLGTSGLPHILMRFFTVKDAREARKSV